MINEAKIIQRLQTKSCGFIGDDAAVLPHTNSSKYVITKDLLVEGIHFRTQYFSPQDLAHKALHVNLSDLAAMGAQPRYILCGIAVPDTLQDYAYNFLSSLSTSCQKAGVILIGGDTTAAKGYLYISITAIGLTTESNNIKYRNTAENNDLICIAGNLGWAHLGFIALENDTATAAKYKNSFLCPTAKIKEGLWLAKQTLVTSMMDISDGLYTDLKKLCAASNKSAVIDIELLQSVLDPDISLQIALEGGEDYGLLLTINQESFEKLSNEFAKIFNYNLKVIGHITDGESITFKQGEQEVDLSINSFTHFGEKG
jgi:thiamine-monophosphate kinase